MPVPYDVDIIQTREHLAALAPEWGDLHSQTAPRNPFLSFEWTAANLDHLACGWAPFVLTARTGGRLVCIAPLRRHRVGPFRVVRFIADQRSDYLGFLCAPGCEDASACILSELSRIRQTWDLLLLRQLTSGFTDLHCVSAPDGLRVAQIRCTVAPYLSLAPGWDALSQSGPAKLRQSARSVRKFAGLGGVIECHAGPSAAEMADEIVADIVQVEAASWKPKGGAARYQSHPDQRLLHDVLRSGLANGTIDVWFARLDGRPIAFALHLLTPERVCFYQGSYREDHGHLAPGRVLFYHAIRAATASGYQEYDFMNGGEAYKSEWTTGERVVFHRALFPNTVRGRLAYGTVLAPRWTLRNSPQLRAGRDALLQLRYRLGLRRQQRDVQSAGRSAP